MDNHQLYQRLCDAVIKPIRLSAAADTYVGTNAAGLPVMVRAPREGRRGFRLDIGRDTVATGLSKDDVAALASKHVVSSPFHEKSDPRDDGKLTSPELLHKMRHLPYYDGGVAILSKNGFVKVAGSVPERWVGSTADGVNHIFQWLPHTQTSGIVFGWVCLTTTHESTSYGEVYSRLDECGRGCTKTEAVGKCEDCGREAELLDGLCASCHHAKDDKEQAWAQQEESLAEPTDAEYTTVVGRLNASLRKATMGGES